MNHIPTGALGRPVALSWRRRRSDLLVVERERNDNDDSRSARVVLVLCSFTLTPSRPAHALHHGCLRTAAPPRRREAAADAGSRTQQHTPASAAARLGFGGRVSFPRRCCGASAGLMEDASRRRSRPCRQLCRWLVSRRTRDHRSESSDRAPLQACHCCRAAAACCARAPWEAARERGSGGGGSGSLQAAASGLRADLARRVACCCAAAGRQAAAGRSAAGRSAAAGTARSR